MTHSCVCHHACHTRSWKHTSLLIIHLLWSTSLMMRYSFFRKQSKKLQKVCNRKFAGWIALIIAWLKTVSDNSSLMNSSVCPSTKSASFWLKNIWLYINYAIQNSMKEHAFFFLLQILIITLKINLLLFPLFFQREV